MPTNNSGILNKKLQYDISKSGFFFFLTQYNCHVLELFDIKKWHFIFSFTIQHRLYFTAHDAHGNSKSNGDTLTFLPSAKWLTVLYRFYTDLYFI